MKKLFTFLFLFGTLYSYSQIVTGSAGSTSATYGAPYKLDIDNNGVKDFWIVVDYQMSDYIIRIVGKNGNKVEIESGIDGNHLSYGNQIGNNTWGDSARLCYSYGSAGNFGGGNQSGYVGLKATVGGQTVYGYVYVQCGSSSAYVDNFAYNANGGAITAGQTSLGISDINDFGTIGCTNNCIQLKANETFRSTATLSVLDLNGKVLHSSTISQATTTVPMEGISKGIYVVTIVSENRILLTKRVVNQ
ncbi:MAG: T9SS type A sorting domain-containing protein [Chitinophagales bacterium]